MEIYLFSVRMAESSNWNVPKRYVMPGTVSEMGATTQRQLFSFSCFEKANRKSGEENWILNTWETEDDAETFLQAWEEKY